MSHFAADIINGIFGQVVLCNIILLGLVLGGFAGIVMYNSFDSNLSTCQVYGCPSLFGDHVYMTADSVVMQIIYGGNILITLLALVGIYMANFAKPTPHSISANQGKFAPRGMIMHAQP